MKKILSLILILGSISMYGQKPDTTKVASPVIICKVKPGEMASFGNHSVKFVKVISDSRCPKGVTCVWAGEAKVLIEIYENGKMIAQKEVVIAPGNTKDTFLLLANKEAQAYGLNPYPVINKPIKAEEYVLSLVVVASSNKSSPKRDEHGSSTNR